MNTILTFAEMLEDSNQRASKLYKWVRVKPAGVESDPEVFRFIEVTYGETHRMLVNEGDVPLAAGTISACNDFWRVYDWGSTTLKIGCDNHAAQDLESAFTAAGRERRSR